MKAQTKFIIGAAIILVTLVWLGWVGASESKTYYHTVSELSSLRASQLRQRMRVSGYVAKGSIRQINGQTDFTIQEGGKTLPVSYVGSAPLPDTFKGGAQAMVQGRLAPSGQFVAQQVQAKCASKYAASTTPLKSTPTGSMAGPQSPAAAQSY
ncbi:MAG TPA: cytochrome c maturation protein CcmE [Patescibacteria group bacterium]|nr:cytochrome c maturation protein CcmE [Patescibacteria group bacterium]